MRVLIFHPALAPYRIDFFNALSASCELRLVFCNRNVTYQSYDQSALCSSLLPDHRFLEFGANILNRSLRLGFTGEIQAFKPDVVVTSEFSQATFAVICRRQFDKSFDNVVWTDDNPMMTTVDSPVRKMARRLLLPFIKALVVNSPETADLYARHYGFKGRIGISPLIQDELLMRRKLEEAGPRGCKLAERHGLIGKKILIYVGRLANVKRLDLLLDAFKEVLKSRPKVKLVMVGDGPERSKIMSKAQDIGVSNEVILAGHTENSGLYAWYNCGSVFALCSDYEPWGAVVNEALMAGIPVICTKQAGARSLISPGGNGELVDPTFTEKFSEALIRWLDKVPELSQSQIASRPPSLMRCAFKDAVDGFNTVICK